MFYLNYIIAILLVNASVAQWTITHYEGYDKSFTQNTLDNYIQLNCQAYNLPIIAQQGSLQKVISLKDLSPFAKTKILVEFIVPLDSLYSIQIQNKTIDSQQTWQLGYGFSMINECFNTSDYKMLSFNYELEGKNYTEISINIQLLDNKSNQQRRYVGIKQIHVFQIQCPQHCQNCEETENRIYCQDCQQNFTLQQNLGTCSCQNFIFKNQCLKQCPEGYSASLFSGCKKVEYLETSTFGQNTNLKINKNFEQSIQLKKSSQVRLDFELILSNFKVFQQIEITVNDIYQGGITNYYSNLYISIFNISETKCQYSSNCTLIKLQTPLIDVNSSNLNLNIGFRPTKSKGHKQRYNRFEDLGDPTKSEDSEIIIQNIQLTQLLIDESICSQDNCKVCDLKYIEQDECKQCKEGFYLFENQCLSQCPEETVVEGFYCKAFLNKQTNSQLILKDIDITQENWAGETSLPDQHSVFQFRFNKTNLLFGGKWRRQEFTKILILQPHYALTYKFTVSYIDLSDKDEETGFFYQLDGGEYNFINPKDLIQIDGDANKPDSIVEYSKYFKHTNNDIMITIGCNTNGFCFLQDYYLIIHTCTPYCKSCTGPSKSECLEFTRNSYEFDYKTKQCKAGYFESDDKVCQRCEVSDCSECISKYQCQICKKGCHLHLQGSRCTCE
ncbi:unnamed protein product (macronuclear) [Paramecium tetraurelia]|uniref:TNFR-Cys domain-containing protein n=1 Tax=Paramecium tetraurelia TaxID=5888 RepID=A0BVH6_PARTE|nr:uncharacterized protein GSPATT00005789001 [Paramecium tetraurelia]CAK62543.1 unnamed protein product [Paramecium tetraurelia]|eukprot:XP_001429941.1 hypothetical protein (macronuclear) [Paramecium tetraurelia strain d4-2]